jgi:hypothetical protein
MDFQETLNAEIPAASEPAAPAAPAGGDEITLGEDGEFNIPDSFWEDMGVYTGSAAEDAGAKPEISDEPAPEPAAPAPAPATAPERYTPDEFAAAFADGAIDESRLSPDVAAFYKATMARVQPPQPQPQLQPQPQIPQMAQLPALNPQQYAQLREAAKKVAAQNMLGIKPEEFDEMEPTHAEAQRFAMSQIQARAQAIAAGRQAEAMRAQQLMAEFRTLDAEYSQKDPEFFAKRDTVIQDYLDHMPYRDATAALAALRSGNVTGIRKFIGDVYGEYAKGKAAAPVTPVSSPAAPAKAPVQAPPPVMRAGGTLDADADAGSAETPLPEGEISEDDLAKWFLKNNYVQV